MKLFDKNFWVGFFMGFTLFVVALVACLLVLSWTARKLPMNTSLISELQRLQHSPLSTVPSVYEEASDWTLTSLDGREMVFGDFKGKVIFLNFWATWCGSCIEEMPSVQRLFDSLQVTGTEFVLVSNEPLEKLRLYAKEKQFRVPIYRTADKVPAVFPVAEVPTTFILNRDGTIMFNHIGGAQWDHPWTMKFIQQVLK
jgi:thiol-disulfide isomerase/thioredoxin